ncbi:response regulator transcription factor [Paenibacillus thalictri]|uniref:Response regulator transcription factor n=1 Tax=Paenibacillus thalictri TaxID=2527873 RepID=A0A4V6MSF7_9BACL|nr:response regulator transcription factor [Paenibacillus thalictri]TBL76280.1 response regulator transcription factor [Paenibacillus thalictri]
MRVLVVEDDHNLREAIASVLEDEQYEVDAADNGHDGLLSAEHGIYDLLILDIMLPGIDGITLIRTLRRKGIFTPALCLTARDTVEARVQGLDAGADDYLVKPFAINELLARIRALLRRSKGFGVGGELAYGAITLAVSEYEAVCNGQTVKLTSKEYELLSYLVQNKEQILKRDQIFNRVWGLDSDANETAVDLYIHYIRKKLMPSGCDHYIHTVRGVGYMLKAGDDHV